MVYITGLVLHTTDWLSRQNQKEDKDEKAAGLKLTMLNVRAAMEVPTCMSIEEIKEGTL